MRPRRGWAAVVSAGVVLAAVIVGSAMATSSTAATAKHGGLPVKKIEKILKIKGTVIHGVLSAGFDRTDIKGVHIGKTPILPSFEINGEVDFQPLGHNAAFMNGDTPLKPNEVDPFISALLRNHITFQAEHQHFYDFNPPVWFIHFRAKGNAVTIAREMHNAFKATALPLPQAPPKKPKTPFNVKRLKQILHGYDAEVGSDGVVTVYVARRNPIHIDGVRVMPETNLATNISFEPLNKSGTEAAAAPDFGMVANEVDSVVLTMRKMGWDIGCLYNQETDEHPQLYFSHEFKTGNPYTLAREVRKGLNHTNSH